MKCIEQIDQIPADGLIVRPEGCVVRIFFDIEPANLPVIVEGDNVCTAPDDLCDCYNVDVAQPASYGAIVSAIVNDKYTADDVQALMANVTLANDPESGLSVEKAAEYQEEWREFCDWRAKAKTVAAAVIDKLG